MNAPARPLGDLINAHVLSLADVAVVLDLPESTLDKLRTQGAGPRDFKIGRRVYILQSDLHKWLSAMAEKGDGHG